MAINIDIMTGMVTSPHGWGIGVVIGEDGEGAQKGLGERCFI